MKGRLLINLAINLQQSFNNSSKHLKKGNNREAKYKTIVVNCEIQ